MHFVWLLELVNLIWPTFKKHMLCRIEIFDGFLNLIYSHPKYHFALVVGVGHMGKDIHFVWTFEMLKVVVFF